MKKYSRIALAAALLLALLLPSAALALSGDTAGNVFFTDALSNQAVDLDVYGTGEDVSLTGCEIGHSALLAGQNLSVNGVAIGSSLRAAGYSILVSDSIIGANATLAGYSVSLGRGADARGVVIASASASFSGTCESLSVFAENVTLDGTVNGDAQISAGTVTIGENAIVTGTLRVTASEQPAIPAGASIGALEFEQASSDTNAAAATTATAVAAAALLKKLSTLLMMIPGRMLLAVLYFFVIGGAVKDAGDMIARRTIPMLLSGLVAIIVLPIAAVILLFTYIGVPAGLLLLCLYALAMSFAVSFCACAVGRRVFPAMHGLVASLIGVAAFSLVLLIPFLGGLVRFGCMLFTLGYFIQTIYFRLKGRPAEPAQPAQPVPPQYGGQAPDGLA